MSDLESKVDALYQLLPSEFTTARNALARTLSGEAAREVKALAKPAPVPWAVNQVFWKERTLYDRVMTTGRALRTAQIAKLEGKQADLPSATEAHRKAIADFATRARELASEGRVNPDAEQLARMLEAISLAAAAPEHAGRFTKAIGLSGFEALAGVTPIASLREAASKTPLNDEAERRERRALEARLKAASRRLETARERESAAREALAEAKAEVAAAEKALADLENGRT